MTCRVQASRSDFLTVLLRFMPPDAKEHVATIFAAGRRITASDSDVHVFLMLCAEASAWLRVAPPGVDPRSEQPAREET